MEEPFPYIEETRPKVQEIFNKHNLDLTSKVINGVNIVCADNSLDYYSPKTLELFKILIIQRAFHSAPPILLRQIIA